MKNRWQKIVCFGLVLIVLALNVTACDLFGGTSDNGGTAKTTVSTTTPVSTEVPVVEIKRVAPNNLDLPGITEVEMVTPEEGAFVVNENAKLWVPPGAVAERTPVIITKFIQPPGELTSTKADAKEVQIISDFYDLGPDNASFDKPVEVTIFYSDEVLPAGADENNIGPVYFDGQNWVPAERQLDIETNSVTFKVKSFPGFIVAVAWGVQIGWPTIVAAGAAIGLGGAVVGNYVTSPLVRGKANEYVTPDDPTVLKWAEKAKIIISVPYKEIYVKDLATNPDLLKEFVNSDHGQIKFENPNDANTLITPKYVRDWPLFDIMQKPAAYFNNGMNGDCEDISVAVASIFRHYGYPAKCVDGSRTEEGKTGGHAWAEIIIGGKPYYLGETGLLEPLDDAIRDYQLTRPTPSSLWGFAWDETGQRPYKDNWWVTELRVTIDEKKAYPGGQVVFDVFGGVGIAMDLELTLEHPNKSETKYSGTTDANTGNYRMTLNLEPDIPTGVYILDAYNPERMILGVGVYVVQPVKIGATVVSSKVAPGEELGINVRLNYPLEAEIEIDGVADYYWVTEKDGTAYLTLTVPENAKLGPYTLTVRAPAYNISTKVNYTVWIPPTLKVNITPKELAPGSVFTVNVLIQPPQVARITIQGYDGRWMTDENGKATPKLPVAKTAAPGIYEVVVEAPDLGLIGSDTFTVTLTPQLSGPINVVKAQLGIRVAGSNEDEEFEARLYVGGQYVRGALDNYQVHAAGRVSAGSINADMRYDFTLSKDLSSITSGSVSLRADNGSTFSFTFSNLPRNRDLEAKIKTEDGLEVLAFGISGAAVSNYLGSFSVNEPAIGSISRYFTGDDSELIVMLFAATDEQLAELFDE